MAQILPKAFCVFILTHGRPDKVVTLTTLEKCGYTGRLYLIVDDEDVTIDRYRENFGAERVIVFDKKAEADRCDEGNNFDERRTILMARNACFGIAKQLGVTHFLELDDDYTDFRYKVEETGNHLAIIKDLNSVFAKLLRFYVTSNATSVAFAQNGDFIGGFDNGKGMYRFSKRKCMNTFLCSTERPFQFCGAMNEDVNTYTTLGNRGMLFFTVPVVAINQKATQSQAGGITAMYQRFGTYCKAFTTVMMAPSAVKVSMMQSTNSRLHHQIAWPRAVPCILAEHYRKPQPLLKRDTMPLAIPQKIVTPDSCTTLIHKATAYLNRQTAAWPDALLRQAIADPRTREAARAIDAAALAQDHKATAAACRHWWQTILAHTPQEVSPCLT